MFFFFTIFLSCWDFSSSSCLWKTEARLNFDEKKKNIWFFIYLNFSQKISVFVVINNFWKSMMINWFKKMQKFLKKNYVFWKKKIFIAFLNNNFSDLLVSEINADAIFFVLSDNFWVNLDIEENFSVFVEFF